MSWRVCKEQEVYLLDNMGIPSSDDLSAPKIWNLKLVQPQRPALRCAAILWPKCSPDPALRVLQNFTVTQNPASDIPNCNLQAIAIP